jgi:hypothetical protein
MKLFHRHLYLFDIFKNISHYNVADFNQDKVTRNQDIVMLVLEDQNEKIITKFVIADTDINALYSFHQDDRLSRFKLKYILREKEITEYLSGKERYSIPYEYKEDIKKIYNEILTKNLDSIHDFYLNMRLISAEYELNEEERLFYIHEYKEVLLKMKEIIRDYKEIGLSKDTAVFLCEDCLAQIVKIGRYYQFNPIENFTHTKSCEYINTVTLNRLEYKQKEEIKRYYEDLPSVYEYHESAIKEIVDESVEIYKNFKESYEIIP